MFSGVSVVLVVLLAPYLRPWLAQRSDIAAQRAQVEALQRQVDRLTLERDRWNDPTFVRAQAREKLNFVMPGELGYVALDEGRQREEKVDPARQAALDAGRMTGRAWYDVLWRSVQIAGRPASAATAPPGPSGAGAGAPAGSGGSGTGTSPSSSPGPTATPGR